MRPDKGNTGTNPLPNCANMLVVVVLLVNGHQPVQNLRKQVFMHIMPLHITQLLYILLISHVFVDDSHVFAYKSHRFVDISLNFVFYRQKRLFRMTKEQVKMLYNTVVKHKRPDT